MSEGILGWHKSSAAGTYTVYGAVPAGKYAKLNISVTSDTTSSNEVVLYITSDSEVSEKDTIQVDTLKNYNHGYDRTALVLKAGEKVVYKTDSANTSVVVTGIEYEGTTEAFSTSTYSATDSDILVYTVSNSSTVVCNLTVSLLGNGSTDAADINVYITKTDIAGGVKLQSERLRRDSKTGFGKNGFVISASDKIIVEANNVVGGVACRVHGMVRGVN